MKGDETLAFEVWLSVHPHRIASDASFEQQLDILRNVVLSDGVFQVEQWSTRVMGLAGLRREVSKGSRVFLVVALLHREHLPVILDCYQWS